MSAEEEKEKENPIVWTGWFEDGVSYRTLGSLKLKPCIRRMSVCHHIKHVEGTSNTDSSYAVLGTGSTYQLRLASLCGYT